MNFTIARNPDADSRLPYLLRLPIEGGLVLKVRETWPRRSRVFCARVEDGWPGEAEVIDEVPVTPCRRRGVAIDLVLDLPRENRSPFVFTTLPSGREGIFWQTRKVVATARPGAGVRLRTTVAKRARVRENALYLVFKIVERLGQHWRVLNGGATVMGLVIAGERFVDGIHIKRAPREEERAA